MIERKHIERITPWVYEIPADFRSDMRVAARFYSDPELLADALGDRSLEQLVNTATLPGAVQYALAIPDSHQGYGFPIARGCPPALPDAVADDLLGGGGRAEGGG